MILSGKTILITRAVHQSQEFVSAIENLGGTSIVFPTIEIVPPHSWEPCDRAIESLYMYDGLIFTSTNGVGSFFQRLSALGKSPAELKTKMICAVGKKTKEAIQQFDLAASAMPEKFTALDLAKNLQQEDLHGKSFLFPRGNLGNNTLAENLKILGALVDSVTVYRTKMPKRENVDRIKMLLARNQIDVLTFTSPSTFKNFIELISSEHITQGRRHVAIAAIGPVTAKAVKEFGFDIDIIPRESTIESLVEAIAQYFAVRTPVTKEN